MSGICLQFDFFFKFVKKYVKNERLVGFTQNKSDFSWFDNRKFFFKLCFSSKNKTFNKRSLDYCNIICLI